MTSWSCWILVTWRCFTFRSRMPHRCLIGFKSGDILGHSISFTFSVLCKAVVILVVCLGSLSCHSQYKHVMASMFSSMSTSSTHAAPDYDITTTMLDCWQDPIFLVLLTMGITTHFGRHLSLRSLSESHPTIGPGSCNSCSWAGYFFCDPASEEALFLG